MGTGNSYDFGGYMLNVRLGRRSQPDPVMNASISPYAVFNNNPIYFIDPNGLEPIDPPTRKGTKEYWSYQINTKIPNDLKKIGRELDNGWRFEDMLKGGKAGGYDFRSDLRVGESYGKVPKGKGTRDTQVVDVTGFDILSTYVGLSTGTKTVSKSGKIIDNLSDFAKAVKTIPSGWTLGQDTGTMINNAKAEMISVPLESYSATKFGRNESQVHKSNKQRDTAIIPSQRGVIDGINNRSRIRAEQERDAYNGELQKRRDYYKQ